MKSSPCRILQTVQNKVAGLMTAVSVRRNVFFFLFGPPKWESARLSD